MSSLLSVLRHAPRTVLLAAFTATMSVGLATVAVPASAVVPKTPRFGTAIENLSPYQPQTTCTSKAQPGVVKFRALILATYKGTGDDGIVRGCKVGGTRTHIYTRLLTFPATGPLQMWVGDPTHGDDSGSLKVTVQRV